MKKIAKTSLCVAAAALVLASCASGPKVDKPPMTKENKPQIIDDQYHGARETPDWIFMQPSDLEGKSDFKDSYVFIFSSQGGDVNGLKAWVRSFEASSEVSRIVSTRVQDKFVGAAAGDKDKLETYMEEVVKSASNAQFSGARKKAEYWWQIRKSNPDGSLQDVYEYYLLYTVPKAEIDSAIKRALSDAADNVKPKSEDEQTARDRVKSVMEQGLD